MQKKIFIGVSILALLSILLFTGIIRETFFRSGSDFIIADTSKISSFTIIGRDTLRFKRLPSSWIVNDQYKVNPLAISNFLYLFKNIKVIGLTNDPGINEASSLKLNIHIGRRSRKLRFYPVPPNSLMHYEGSSKFYQIEVTGSEKADLNNIITSDINIWRDKLLFNLGINDLKRIIATPKKEWGSGFEMFRYGDKFLLKNQQGVLLDSSDYDIDHLIMYAGYFQEVFFDSAYIFNSHSKTYPPNELQYELIIESMKAETKGIQIYAIPSTDGHTDMLNAGCRINNGDEIYVVPYIYLDPLLMTLEQFLVE
jgi:hypothetical protein